MPPGRFIPMPFTTFLPVDDDPNALLDALLAAGADLLQDLEDGPENRATGIALADARAWQVARRAVDTAAGGRRQRGLGWEEV